MIFFWYKATKFLLFLKMLQNIEKHFIENTINIYTNKIWKFVCVNYVLFQTIASIEIIDHNDFFNDFFSINFK